MVSLIRKTKININQQHLFESNEIIAYICCYKTFFVWKFEITTNRGSYCIDDTTITYTPCYVQVR
jgi:hypothetical protein